MVGRDAVSDALEQDVPIGSAELLFIADAAVEVTLFPFRQNGFSRVDSVSLTSFATDP